MKRRCESAVIGIPGERRSVAFPSPGGGAAQSAICRPSAYYTRYDSFGASPRSRDVRVRPVDNKPMTTFL
jgi:hypothetical protein